MTEILTEDDLAQHVAQDLELPIMDDLGAIPEKCNNPFKLAETFFMTFCSDEERENPQQRHWR